ncbi:hypothetical protein UP09_03375 [Bradyrhizobium sp. LTSP885]|uniref:hypothetical protein n=1 Tax=Bradyrhizobium sp. LTSP885 TaxID=1619232 RepID=UPI0005CB4250|nr:hypothetical protein [Bradyrhizobium sp. LTSP885]KJC51094.1 hypothetical protein UP09_03375 [Bradyrhizobium sp. LTSP885]
MTAKKKPVRPVSTDEAKRIVALQDQVNRLTKDLRKALRDGNSNDIISDVLGGIVNTPKAIPAWVRKAEKRERHKATPEVPVTMWSDWHLGEVVTKAEVNGANEYNMTIARERIERLFSVTEKLLTENHTNNYPGMVINLTGDMVSGGLHPELVATDELEAIPASIKAFEWIAGGIARFADKYGRVYVPCVPGNHGRTTHRPEFKRYYRKNYDWLIYQMLIRHFASDPRVQFDVRPSNEVLYRVFNIRYLLLHGDMLGVGGGDGIIGAIGPIRRGEVKKSGAYSSQGTPFDMMLHGHYHQKLWLPNSTGAGSPKGYCEYVKNALNAKPERPTQPLWSVHEKHGQTAHWDVYVDKPPKKSSEWMAVLGAHHEAA